MLDDFERILQSIGRSSEFPRLEVLKSNVRRERGTLMLSVTVDRDGGVDTNLCEAISRYITRRADALPPPVPAYQIEVASAGLDRPLLTPQHFIRFTGRVIKVITTLRIANRTEFTGEIVWADDNVVCVADPHAGQTQIPYGAIKRANLVYEPAEDFHKAKAQRRDGRKQSD